MEKNKILEVLNEIDGFVLNNLNDRNRFQDVDNIQVRMRLGQLQTINDEFEKTGERGLLASRASTLYKAYMLAMGTPARNTNMAAEKAYFDYVRDTRKLEGTGAIESIDSALLMIVNAVNTRNVPKQQLLDYMEKQTSTATLNPSQIKMYTSLKDMINKIAQIEEQAKANPEQETALVVKKEKTSVFQKIKDWLNKFTSKGNKKAQSADTPMIQRAIENNEKQFQQSIRQDDFKPIIPVEMSAPKKEYIVISDLHGDMSKWQSVKETISDNPSLKVIMLGDAMDRGNFGPEILLQIKELNEQGKVEYLPGNHDIFTYNYLMAPQNTSSYTTAKLNLQGNNGEMTMKKLDQFDRLVEFELGKGTIQKPVTRQEMVDWLGKLPIQKKTQTGDINYALSHAMFDDKLYQYDKNFNLEKALMLELNGQENSEVYRRFMNSMWYREADSRTHYADIAYPENCAVVVGHTAQKAVNMQTQFQNDPKRVIVYVDTGNGQFEGFDLEKGESISIKDKSIGAK